MVSFPRLTIDIRARKELEHILNWHFARNKPNFFNNLKKKGFVLWIFLCKPIQRIRQYASLKSGNVDIFHVSFSCHPFNYEGQWKRFFGRSMLRAWTPDLHSQTHKKYPYFVIIPTILFINFENRTAFKSKLFWTQYFLLSQKILFYSYFFCDRITSLDQNRWIIHPIILEHLTTGSVTLLSASLSYPGPDHEAILILDLNSRSLSFICFHRSPLSFTLRQDTSRTGACIFRKILII